MERNSPRSKSCASFDILDDFPKESRRARQGSDSLSISKGEWHPGQRQIMGTKIYTEKDTALSVLIREVCVRNRDAKVNRSE